MSPEQAATARRAESADTRTQAALTLAATLVRTRGDLDDTDLKSAYAAGLSDAEVAEVIANVALNLFTNYFNKAAAVDIDWPEVSHLS